MSQQTQKERAATESLSRVQDGMTVGLGSGSTAELMIRGLGERVKAGLSIRGVPTSSGTKKLAEEVGIPLITLDDCEEIDVTIDGADEVDANCNLIKGGGGALLYEKIVASDSLKRVIIVDSRKKVNTLGAFDLPVEVIPLAVAPVIRRIAGLGCVPKRRLTSAGEPFITDEGNAILDCPFGRIEDPRGLATALNLMPGLVEHGLFIGLTDEVIVAHEDRIEVLTPKGFE